MSNETNQMIAEIVLNYTRAIDSLFDALKWGAPYLRYGMDDSTKPSLMLENLPAAKALIDAGQEIQEVIQGTLIRACEIRAKIEKVAEKYPCPETPEVLDDK